MYKRPQKTDTEDEILQLQDNFNKEKEKNKDFKPAAEVVKINRPVSPKNQEIKGKKQSMFSRNRETRKNEISQKALLISSHIIGDIIERNPTQTENVNKLKTNNDTESQITDSNQTKITETTDRTEIENNSEKKSNTLIGDIIERNFDDQRFLYKQPTDNVSFPKSEKLPASILASKEKGKSLFAQSFERNMKEMSESDIHKNLSVQTNLNSNSTTNPKESLETDSSRILESRNPSFPSLIDINTDSTIDHIKKEIDLENLKKLRNMDNKEILEAQDQIRSAIPENLQLFLQNRKKSAAKPPKTETVSEPISPKTETVSEPKSQNKDNVGEMPSMILNTPGAHGWLNFNILESEKLQWTESISNNLSAIKPGEEYEARFDWNGFLMPFHADEKLSQDRNLFIHGEEPDRPGYTLTELLRLGRSNILQQRISALKSITGIIAFHSQGFYDGILQLPHAKLFFYLRFAMDDSAFLIISEATKAMASLIYNDVDEFLLDLTYDTVQGIVQPDMKVQNAEVTIKEDLSKINKKETNDDDPNQMNDYTMAEMDLIECLNRSNIAIRIRYILLSFPSDKTTTMACFKILIRMLRTGKDFKQTFMNKEYLEPLIQKYLPETNISEAEVMAMKMVRIIITYGYYTGYGFFRDFNMLAIVKKYLFTEVTNTIMLKIQIEAMRLVRMKIELECDNSIYIEVLPAVRSLLQWHYQFLLFDVDQSMFYYQNAAALIQLIKSGNLMNTYSNLRDIIPLCLCKWFTLSTRYGCSDPVRKILLAGCLDMALDVISMDPNLLDDFATKYLPGFLMSPTFRTMHRDLRETSLIMNDFNDRSGIMSALPNLGGVILRKNLNTPSLVLAKNNPVFFEHSLLNFIIKLNNNNPKAVKYFENLISLFMNDSFGQCLSSYIELSMNKWRVKKLNWFARYEINFLVMVLKCIRNVFFIPQKSLLQIHFNLLNLFTLNNYVDLMDIFRNVIFTNHFYGDIRVEEDKWVVYENTYVAALPPMKYPKNMLVAYDWSDTILPYYWPYAPLYGFVENLENGIFETEPGIETMIIITTIKFDYILCESEVKILSPTEKLMYLMTAFLSNDTCFLENRISFILWEYFYSLDKLSNTMFDFTRAKLQNMKSFESLYILLWDQFAAKGYADRLFCNVLLIPLQQKYDSRWRLMAWSDYSTSLQYITSSENDVFGCFENYMQPVEKDLSVLQAYSQAINSNIIRPNSIMYKIAVHHLNAYKKFYQEVAKRNI